MPQRSKAPLPLLALFMVLLSFVAQGGAQETTLPLSSCSRSESYKEQCQLLNETDRCSAQLTTLCCSCQKEWGVEFRHCQFSTSLHPTPTFTPTSTATPTATSTPTATVTPSASPTDTPSPTGTAITPAPQPTPIGAEATPTPLPLPTATPALIVTPSVAPCSNGKDDDGDSLTDYPADPGCESALDLSEVHSAGPACDDGIDNDGDALIDISDSGCANVSDTTEEVDIAKNDCVTYRVHQEVKGIVLSLETLKKLALTTLKNLQKASKKTPDKALGRRLAKSAVSVKMIFEKELSNINFALKELPELVVVCPQGVKCVEVDNSEIIRRYETSVRIIGNQALRTMNRASRLIASSLQAARKQTKKLDAKIKITVKDLLGRSARLPRTESRCF